MKTSIFICFIALCLHYPVFGETNKFKHQLAICAIFKNEAPYLKEWIEFHRLLGVEHFYLYNNRSSDHYLKVLKPYIKKKIVELIPWPFRYDEAGHWSPIQCSAYQQTIEEVRGKVKWLALLDIDEFLYPVKEDNLIDFLNQYDSFGAVGVNWQMFGTSHLAKIPENKLLIESLYLKAPVNYNENYQIKSIVQPHKVSSCANPHFCFLKTGFYQVNANGDPIKGHMTSKIFVDKVRVNHYWTRDEDFFYRVKLPRRQAWSEGMEGILKRLEILNSEVDDGAIQRFVPSLRKKIYG